MQKGMQAKGFVIPGAVTASRAVHGCVSKAMGPGPGIFGPTVYALVRLHPIGEG